jgi:hypothetical protein
MLKITKPCRMPSLPGYYSDPEYMTLKEWLHSLKTPPHTAFYNVVSDDEVGRTLIGIEQRLAVMETAVTILAEHLTTMNPDLLQQLVERLDSRARIVQVDE